MTTFTQNEITYTTHKIEVRGNKYAVTVATGKMNYINVVKLTNNPFRGPGLVFENFDQAQKHYKSAEMKVELLKIETGII